MPKDQEQVVLVDLNDQAIGFMEKLQAHKIGKLHRAVSVFVFNDEGHLMIQQRAFEKYHSGALWANTACSHPHKGEPVEAAAHRRLKEEMGFDCVLHKKFCFTYKSVFNNGLTEHEFDHVFVGNYNNAPAPNHREVANWRWISLQELQKEMEQFSENYAIWFKIILKRHLNELIV